MAKKKEIKLESQQTRGVGEGADPNDPVAIIYDNDLIASLNDTDDEGVLKTGGTIVPHDIHVRYAGGGSGESPIFILRFTLNDSTHPNSYDSTTTIGELHDALAAKKYIIALIDQSPDDDNISFTYPVIPGLGFYEDNGKWILWMTMNVGTKTLDFEGNEDDASSPISITIPIG